MTTGQWRWNLPVYILVYTSIILMPPITAVDGLIVNSMKQSIAPNFPRNDHQLLENLPNTIDATRNEGIQYVSGHHMHGSHIQIRIEEGFQDIYKRARMDETWGNIDRAITGYAKALTYSHSLSDEELDARNRLGLLLMEVFEFDKAIEVYMNGIMRYPNKAELYGNLACAYLHQGDVAKAIETSLHAISIEPHHGALHHNTGNAFQQAGLMTQAIFHWEQATYLSPTSPQSWFGLGIAWGNRGFTQKSIEHFETSLMIAKLHQPELEATASLQLATAILPQVYMSKDEIQMTRKQYLALLLELWHRVPLHFPNLIYTTGCGSMGYYLVYQGYQDKPLRHLLANIYKRSEPLLNFIAPHVRDRSVRMVFPLTRKYLAVPTLSSSSFNDRKIRLGVLSSFLFYHSVGLLLQSVLTRLSNETYEIFLLRFPHEEDHITEKFQGITRHDILLPKNVYLAQRIISNLRLDVLLYTEIGMDSYSYFLAFSTLALRSVMFWGHAITSGIPSVDYFITSISFESIQRDFTEKLYYMESLTVTFGRPQFHTSFDGISFVDQTRVMYLIPQTLYKLHPDMDALLNRILKAHPESYLVLLEGATKNLAEQIKQRLRQTLTIENFTARVIFAPPLPRDAFLSLCEAADVVLDPFPLGGGRSSFEIFSVGTPIVVHSARTNVLKLTSGMYKKMGILDLIASNDDDYVSIALKLGMNETYRKIAGATIQERSSVLFDTTDDVVADWDRCLHTILAQPPPSEVSFGMRLNLFGKTIEVLLKHSETPASVASTISKVHNLEPLQEMYVKTLLTHGELRKYQPLVFEIGLLDEYPPIEIHFGDDIDLAIQFFLWKNSIHMDSRGVSALRSIVSQVVNGADSTTSWLAVRKLPGYVSSPLPPPDEIACITIVVTTCKRLPLFLASMASIEKYLAAIPICMIMVIDDHSSAADRTAMEQSYPHFKFIFTQQKGHAHSLNLLLDLVSTRYVMYLEDDWKWLDQLTTNPVLDSLMILREEPNLVQIQLNTQESGWRRDAYWLHEFGIVGHTFGYWPGFSLNPALWDLGRLRQCNVRFNESNDIFEREFSLTVWRCGLQVGFLPYSSTIHIGAPPGTNESAYVLNGMPRRFDSPSSP